MISDLRYLMRRAHAVTRRLMMPGVVYRTTLGLVLRRLWALLRRPLATLLGRRKRDVRKAENLRDRWLPHYVREIEDAVLEWQDVPDAFERGIELTAALFTTDAAFWLDVGKCGLFGLDRVGELVDAA